MAEEHYSQEEALKKLALKQEELEKLVRDGRLREFRIDGQVKYKISEIDTLAEEINPSMSSASADTDLGSESSLELLPADSTDGGTDVISLDESGDQIAPVKAGKEDTVVTPAGVSVFDEDELAGFDADPMAKTQIAPSVTDELSLEGGGGSGLLDMTRESDDTSLGAELLDEIYADGKAAPPEKGGEEAAEPEAFEEVEPAAAATAPRAFMVEVVDPMAGMFTGLLVAAAILMGFAGLVAAGLTVGVLPGFVGWISSNILFGLIGAVVITAVGLVIGYILDKK